MGAGTGRRGKQRQEEPDVHQLVCLVGLADLLNLCFEFWNTPNKIIRCKFIAQITIYVTVSVLAGIGDCNSGFGEKVTSIFILHLTRYFALQFWSNIKQNHDKKKSLLV